MEIGVVKATVKQLREMQCVRDGQDEAVCMEISLKKWESFLAGVKKTDILDFHLREGFGKIVFYEEETLRLLGAVSTTAENYKRTYGRYYKFNAWSGNAGDIVGETAEEFWKHIHRVSGINLHMSFDEFESKVSRKSERLCVYNIHTVYALAVGNKLTYKKTRVTDE